MLPDPVDILQKKFFERQRKNPSYSLRAFAKSLGISSGGLSEILNRKRRMTEKFGMNVTEVLNFNSLEKQYFLKLIKAVRGEQITFDSKEDLLLQMEIDNFELIANWYHIVILNIIGFKGIENDVTFIANKIGITELETRESLNLLERLGHIVLKGEKWHRLSDHFKTTSDIPSQAIKQMHRNILDRTKESLDLDGLEIRDFTSKIIRIDREKIGLAKKLIRDFHIAIEECLCSEKDKNEDVYFVNVQLAPATRKVIDENS